MTTSKRGVRKTERIIEAEDYTDGSHPAGGNFVLMDKGRAWYGGVLYTRAEMASVTFPEPEPQPENKFKPGDTVKVLTDEFSPFPVAGSIGTVVAAFDPRGSYSVDVEFKDSEDKGTYPFGEDELELYVGLKVNDRVVYTPPATYLGYPGTDIATPGLVGELGTVTEASPGRSPVVRWDNAGSLRHASAFLAVAPEYRAVSYDRRDMGRQVGIERTADGGIAGFLRADTPEGRADMLAKVDTDPESWAYDTDHDGTYTNVQPL